MQGKNHPYAPTQNNSKVSKTNKQERPNQTILHDGSFPIRKMAVDGSNPLQP